MGSDIPERISEARSQTGFTLIACILIARRAPSFVAKFTKDVEGSPTH